MVRNRRPIYILDFRINKFIKVNIKYFKIDY